MRLTWREREPRGGFVWYVALKYSAKTPQRVTLLIAVGLCLGKGWRGSDGASRGLF